MGDSFKQVIQDQAAPTPRGAYSQGWRAGDFIFVSGQVPIDPATGEIVAGPFRNQVKQTLSNVAAVLRAHNATLDDVVKFTVIVTNQDDFAELNAAFREMMSDPLPARTTFRADLRGVPVEIDAIAYVGTKTASPLSESILERTG